MVRKRETNYFGLVLSYRNLTLKDLPARQLSIVLGKVKMEDMTKEEILWLKHYSQRHVKSLLNVLHYKAKKFNWQYSINLGSSIKNGKTGNPERLHTHVEITCNPASTMINYLRRYWHRRYGMVKYKSYDEKTWLSGYIERQSFYTWTRSNWG